MTIYTLKIRMYSRVSLHMYVHVRDEICMYMRRGYLVYHILFDCIKKTTVNFIDRNYICFSTVYIFGLITVTVILGK